MGSLKADWMSKQEQEEEDRKISWITEKLGSEGKEIDDSSDRWNELEEQYTEVARERQNADDAAYDAAEWAASNS